MDDFLTQLPSVLQSTYFWLNPLNPTNTEDNYQELLRINLERLHYAVDSEVSVQKTTRDIHKNIVKLKNKTERYDLTLDPLSILMELKNLVDLDDYCVHQMLGYLDHSAFTYGILINFAKSNKKNDYRCSFKVYKKNTPLVATDQFGHNYTRYSYTLIREFSGDNYMDLFPTIVSTEVV